MISWAFIFLFSFMATPLGQDYAMPFLKSKMTAIHFALCGNLILTWGGGGLPYITNGDSRRNVQKKPLTILGVAQADFIP